MPNAPTPRKTSARIIKPVLSVLPNLRARSSGGNNSSTSGNNDDSDSSSSGGGGSNDDEDDSITSNSKKNRLPWPPRGQLRGGTASNTVEGNPLVKVGNYVRG